MEYEELSDEYIIEVTVNQYKDYNNYDPHFVASRVEARYQKSYADDIDVNGVYAGALGLNTTCRNEEINDSHRSTSSSPLEIKIDADSSSLVSIPTLKIIRLDDPIEWDPCSCDEC